MTDTTNNEVINRLPVHETEHIIKTGDILYVSIKSINPEVNQIFNPESNMEVNSMGTGFQKYTTPSGAYLYGYEVDVDGFIKLPNLGKIKVSGVPQSGVGAVVQKKVDEYLKDAIVNVKLLNYKITVLGEVKVPGIYYNYNNSITVLEAIALANGNTDYASIKNVMVIRPYPEGNKTFLLDVSSKEVYKSEAFYLQPNDYVMVRPDKYKNFQLNSQAYSLFFSSLSILMVALGLILK
jgi:polysaccharide export outer membrane protein